MNQWLVKQQIGITVIAIAAGESVGIANRTLIMTMNMHQLHHMSAK